MKYMVAELMFTVKEASYENGMICLTMSDQKEIRFPVEVNKKLKNADELQRKNIEIICGGTGLHWPDIDEDLSVIGIMEGRFGY
ncbi:MAG: DUF2442 domain-containing protein [Bacteroidia bacterium]|nr:DUF2442 domain-containing protein [Bacteroidia bacterium]